MGCTQEAQHTSIPSSHTFTQTTPVSNGTHTHTTIELEGSKHEVRKELNRGKQGWLNEDNEIEPGENTKQLNKGMLG